MTTRGMRLPIHTILVDCTIVGPAVVLPLGCEFIECDWGAADGAESLMWPVDPARSVIVGAIGLLRCRFERCTFLEIGIAGNQAALERWRGAVAAGGSVTVSAPPGDPPKPM